MRGHFAHLEGTYRRARDAVERMRGVRGNFKCWLCRDLKPWHWPQLLQPSTYDTDEVTDDDWEPTSPVLPDSNVYRPRKNELFLTVAELRMSAPSCPACAAILTLLEQNIPNLNSRREVELESTHNELRIDARELFKYPADVFELYRHAPPADRRRVLWPAVRVARSLYPSFSVEDARSLIEPWLRDCESNHHEACGAKDVRGEPPLPSRVIAVGGVNQDPRLYETQQGETGQYVALSHCWGPPGTLSLTTTRENLLQRKQAIPMQDLPPTFLDAVNLCRALDIPHLWIDSLCIIQDDSTDWDRESGRMADVYGNATLTFSADGALSSQDGLFQPVSRRQVPASIKFCCSSSPTAEEDESNYVYGRKIFTHNGNVYDDDVHTITGVPPWIREPLRRRAWTYQEYLLSRRIVHFTTGELLWDCRTIAACECQIQKKFSKRPQLDSSDDYYWYTPRMSNSQWWSHIETLTRRQITVEWDILPALAGIAKVVSTQMPHDDFYIAGHWGSELPYSLIWRRGGQKNYTKTVTYGDTNVPCRRQTKYIAPSWAWPSVVGPIYHDYPVYNTRPDWHRTRYYWEEHVICDILKVSYELATSNAYSYVKSGSIDIRGPTLMLCGCVDAQDERRNEKHRRLRTHLEGGEIKVRFTKDEWQPDQAASPEDVLYLPIVARCYRPDFPKVSVYYVVHTKGLALKKEATEKDGVCTYVRVGLLRVHFYRRKGTVLKERRERKTPVAKEVLMTEFQLSEETVRII